MPTSQRKTERLATLLILVLGAVHAFATRQLVNGDGVSYVDIADKWLHLDSTAAVNGYFSPLYSWFLMLPLALNPSPRMESPLVHLLNYGLLIASLLAFRFFWSQLQRSFPEAPSVGSTLVAYSLFAWASLDMVSLGMVSPDQLYGTIIFLLMGVLIHLHREQTRTGWLWAVALGVIWCAAYLARAAALPVIAVTALIAFWSLRRSLPSLIKLASAAGLAIILSSPWAIALSRSKGYPTVGSTGSMIYAWHINGQPWEHARLPGMKHPTRLLSEAPTVYEFASPIIGTYPPWTDPSYWDEGMPMTIDIKANVIHLAKNLRIMLVHLLRLSGFLAALAAWWFWNGDPRSHLRTLIGLWWMWLPCLAGLGVYAALNVEPRYFASFWIIALLCLWVSVRPNPQSQQVANALAVGVALTVLLSLAEFTVTQFYLGGDGEKNMQTAEALNQAGVSPGAGLATIAIDNDIHWARLARTRVVAEIPTQNAQEFWNATPARQQEVLDLLRAAGVRYVVSGQPPRNAVASAWKPVGPRSFYLLPL